MALSIGSTTSFNFSKKQKLLDFKRTKQIKLDKYTFIYNKSDKVYWL